MMESLSGLRIGDEFINAADLTSFSLQKLKNKNMPGWEKKIYSFIIEFLNDSDNIIQESSGTTGTPKKFSLSKNTMIHSAQQTIDFFGLKKNQVALLCLPLDYIAGKMMIIRAMLAGMNLKWVKPSTIPEIQQEGSIDFCAMVPLQVYHLIKSGFDFNYLKTLIIGGAELSPELEDHLQDVSTSVYETFGMAETSSHIALRKVNGVKPESCFTALPDVRISVDERNCLIVEAAYLPHPVITNDIVELLDNKRFCWTGRIDNLINSGGLKISPEAVEKEIYSKTGYELYLIGIPDATLGYKPVLVTDKNISLYNKKVILNKIHKTISFYHIKPEIIKIKSLPDTQSLKTDRKKITEIVTGQSDKNN